MYVFMYGCVLLLNLQIATLSPLLTRNFKVFPLLVYYLILRNEARMKTEYRAIVSFFCNPSLMRGGRPAITISRPSHILLLFSFEPSRNPRPSNIIFKVFNSPRQNNFLRIRSRQSINEILNFYKSKFKFLSAMFCKIFTFFYSYFQIFLVQNAANNSKFIDL